jgi:hypothetical protein
MSQYVWRSSHVIVSKLSRTQPPDNALLISAMLVMHDGAEGGLRCEASDMTSPTTTKRLKHHDRL